MKFKQYLKRQAKPIKAGVCPKHRNQTKYVNHTSFFMHMRNGTCDDCLLEQFIKLINERFLKKTY